MSGKRFCREDWLDFGLAQLAKEGPEALRVLELCSLAGKTVGSFYHHFKDQAAFFDAMVDHWMRINTIDMIQLLESVSDKKEKMNRLETIATSLDQAVEIGMRNFAQKNQTAAIAVKQVDHLRISYAQTLLEKHFGLASDEALNIARLEYATLVGIQMVWPNEVAARAQCLSSLLHTMFQAYRDRAVANQPISA